MLCISVNFRRTEAGLRQRFAFSEEEQKEFLHILIEKNIISGGVILSTCNRSELYVTADMYVAANGESAAGDAVLEKDTSEAQTDQDMAGTERSGARQKRGLGFSEAEDGKRLAVLEKELAGYKNLTPGLIRRQCLFYQGKQAVLHLYKVVCGLDSMVVGEDEIFRQVKEAYQLSSEICAVNAELNLLFQGAFHCAKLSKSETQLAQMPVSIGTLTANYVEQYLQKKYPGDRDSRDRHPKEKYLEERCSGEREQEERCSEERDPGKRYPVEREQEERCSEERDPGERYPGEEDPEEGCSDERHSRDIGRTGLETDQKGTAVLVIGASGKIGSIVAKDLIAKGISVIGTSRSHPSAEGLWQSEEMTWVQFRERYQYINQVGAVVSATKSPHYTLTRDEFLEAYDGIHPMLLVDLAVPYDIDRDIVPEAGESGRQDVERNLNAGKGYQAGDDRGESGSSGLVGAGSPVQIAGIDHFRELSRENNIQKLSEAQKAEQILSECAEDVLKRLYIRNFQMAVPDREEEWFSKMIFYLKGVLDSETLLKVLTDILNTSISGIRKG